MVPPRRILDLPEFYYNFRLDIAMFDGGSAELLIGFVPKEKGRRFRVGMDVFRDLSRIIYQEGDNEVSVEVADYFLSDSEEDDGFVAFSVSTLVCPRWAKPSSACQLTMETKNGTNYYFHADKTSIA